MTTRDAEAFDSQTRHLHGGKLHVFKRKESRFWWCGFYHGKKYFRASTSNENSKEADKVAETWYFQKRLELAGVPPVASKQKSFAVAATKAVAIYQAAVNRGDRSAAYFHALRIVIEKQLVPVIGNEAVASINQATWNRYQEHMYKKRAYNVSERSGGAIRGRTETPSEGLWILSPPRLPIPP